MPAIPALRRLRKQNHEFQVTLGYIERSCLQKKETKAKEKGKEEDEHKQEDVKIKKKVEKEWEEGS
jgi:hypothetical protein